MASKRLIALAAQKFISDIAQDSMQYCKSRMAGTAGAAKERKGKVRLSLIMHPERACTRPDLPRPAGPNFPRHTHRRTSGWC